MAKQAPPQHARDNRASHLNPNNAAHEKSRASSAIRRLIEDFQTEIGSNQRVVGVAS